MKVTITAPVGEISLNMDGNAVHELFGYVVNLASHNFTELSTDEAKPKTLNDEAPVKQSTSSHPLSRIDRMFGQSRRGVTTKQSLSDSKKQDYTGFLLIKCTGCGKIRGFCAKSPVSKYICHECEHEEDLKDLKRLYLQCKCGNKNSYRTNVTDQIVEYSCLNCGAPVSMEYNSRKDVYQTIGADAAGGGYS